jgi:hypothetical protein
VLTGVKTIIELEVGDAFFASSNPSPFANSGSTSAMRTLAGLLGVLNSGSAVCGFSKKRFFIYFFLPFELWCFQVLLEQDHEGYF